MTFTPIQGCCLGWEVGHVVVPASQISGTVLIGSSTVHTGGYSIYCSNVGSAANSKFYFILPTPQNDIYTGIWFYRATDGAVYGLPEIRVDTSDSNAEIIYTADVGFNIYVNSVLVATGTKVVAPDGWHHVQVYWHLANSSGQIEVYLDGILHTSYTGDTLSGASANIVDVTMRANGLYGVVHWDDCSIGTGGYPGDIRYDKLLPTSDIDTGWTPSTGLTQYGVIDEVPPSDTDYISSDTNGQVSTVGLEDWTSTNKAAVFVTSWVRGLKSEAAAHQITIGQVDGSANVASLTVDPTTSFAFHPFLRTVAPDGGAWNGTKINDLRHRTTSVIV